MSSSEDHVDHPAIVRHVYPNGLTLLVQEDHSHPLVAFHATVRTGSATEGKFAGTGISHVVEHMLFKGTARRAVGAVEKEARSYGGTSQGMTTHDTTSYQLIVNKEYWAKGADLLVDALFSPSMDNAELAKELQVVLRELKMGKDDPEHQAYDLLFENLYRIHPYHLPIIGYEPVLLKITRDDVVKYHRRWYIPNEMVIAVVGDVESEQVIQQFTQLTASLLPGPAPDIAVPQEPIQLTQREVIKERSIELGSAMIGFPAISVAHPDLFALDLLSWILGGGRGSRLDQALKETGLVHSVGSWNYTPKDPGVFVVTLRADANKLTQAVEAALKELDRVRREPFTSKELEVAKKAFLRGYLESRQTVSGQAADIAGYEVLLGDPQFFYHYMEKIKQLTPEDLKQAANRYVQLDRATIVKLFPTGTIPPESQKENRTPKASPVVKHKLKNGLTVLLKEDHRLPLVTFQLSALGGVRYETEKNNGISLVTARMLLRGTRNKTRQQIVDAIRDIGAAVQPSSGRNSMNLMMQAVSQQTDPALHLLSELIQQPVFPKEELEKEKTLLCAEIKAQEEEPFPWASRRLFKRLFARHPYRLSPSGEIATVSGLTQSDVEQFYRRILTPQHMVLTIVGDFQAQPFLKKVQEELESLQGPLNGSLDLPAEPQIQRMQEYKEDTARREGVLMIGFHGLRLNDPQVPQLDLIEEILSGGAGRFFSEVREKRGLSYTVGAFGFDGIEPGGFILYALADPEQIPVIRTVVLDEMEHLQKVRIPEEELQQAKQGLLGSKRIARQTQESVATEMSLNELCGLGYDYSERYEEILKKTTAEDILRLAQKLFDTSRCVVIIGQPAKTPLLSH